MKKGLRLGQPTYLVKKMEIRREALMKKGFGLLRQVNGPVESGVQASAAERR